MNECVNRSEASDTVLVLPPSLVVGLPPFATIVSLQHQKRVFFSPGERGAKGDPGAPGVGLRGEMGPPGIPGRSGWAAVWGRGGARPQGVRCKEQPSGCTVSTGTILISPGRAPRPWGVCSEPVASSAHF